MNKTAILLVVLCCILCFAACNTSTPFQEVNANELTTPQTTEVDYSVTNIGDSSHNSGDIYF